MATDYNEASIKTLSSTEHIRLRPGMYIGRLGNGAHAEDGIYVLLKETIDNSIDEFTMGAGKKIEIELQDRSVKVRDYGRGIPLGKLLECVSIINTGAKYDSETFQKAVGLNGVGQKAVNALAVTYQAQAFRDGQTKVVEFGRGKLKKDHKVVKTEERNGTQIEFTPDEQLFGADFKFRTEFIEDMLWNYAFLNRGLTLTLNGKPFKSEHGLKDLLTKEQSGEPLYPIIHAGRRETSPRSRSDPRRPRYGEGVMVLRRQAASTTTDGRHASPSAFTRSPGRDHPQSLQNRVRRRRRAKVDRCRHSGPRAGAGVRVPDQDQAGLERPIGPGRPSIRGMSPAGSCSRPSTAYLAQESRDGGCVRRNTIEARARAKGAGGNPQPGSRAREESLAPQPQAPRLPPPPR